jgi:signal transduction histidine kinase
LVCGILSSAMRKPFASLKLLMVLVLSAEASVPVLLVGEPSQVLGQVEPPAEFLVDLTAELDIAQVTVSPWSEEFNPPAANPPSFGFTRAAVWMRCEVRSVGTEAEMVRFELRSARISEVTWYVVADGLVEKSVAGGSAERGPAFGRYPAIEVELPPGQTRTVFARAVSDTSLLLPFEAGSPAVMQQVEWRRSVVDLLLVGFCLAAAAFLAMSGFTQRQPMFFYLALFALAYAGYYAIFYGFVAEFWPARPFWIERVGFGVASALGIFAFLRFNGTYLDTRSMARHERVLQRTAEGLMLLGAGLLVVLDFRRAMFLLNLLMALSLILGTVVIILRARHHRQREEIWFFLAWLAFTVCIGLLTLQFVKVLPVAIPLNLLQKLLIPSVLAAFFLVASARQRSLQRLQIQLAETEARRSQAEEERDAKSLFLAEVSHEIRTPLSALVGLSQAMWLRCSTREIDPEFTQFLNRVRSGGQYLSLLLRNVLNVSAAESGRVPVRLTAFYLADWAGEIRNILEPIADFHHGHIAWALPDNDEARLCTDEMRLTQIILNLAENALKFGSGGGEPVAIALEKTSCGLRLVVEDRGPGIDSERLDAVFAEFEQADGVQGTPMATGVGLGLAVVKLNTGLLGGALHVNKSASGGMRFEVEIPDRADQLSAAPTAAESPPGQPA